MKKAVIYAFSGTGNTKIAAFKIAENLNALAIETTVFDVRKPFLNVPDPNDYDIVGFGYPIHAFNTPQFFLRFVRTLPKVDNMPAFVFKTSGEPFHANSASTWPLMNILKRKGFRLVMDKHLLTPYNIMFRYKDSMAKQMYMHTEKMAKVIAVNIANGEKQKIFYYPWTILTLYFFRLQWFGAWINGPMIHVKKDLCSGCGLCAKMCPAGNITMKDDLPHFSYHCTMCMSCAARCPNDAIRPGFLNPWRINGLYPFKQLAKDASVPDTYVNDDTKGYFRLFRRYYERTGKEIASMEEKLEQQAEQKNL